MPTVAFVQARMGSERLPGKTLANIAGRPMLWHVVERVRRAKLVDAVVVATSDAVGDDAIAAFCDSFGVPCFRGSESDVLDRYYRAALAYDSDPVVRVTGDCPLIDPHVVDKVIAVFDAGAYDYVTNTIEYTYPDGLDVEVFSFDILQRAVREARAVSDREHVTPFMRTSPDIRRQNVKNTEAPLPEPMRWTVDEAADLRFVGSVFEHLAAANGEFGMTEVLTLVKTEPALLAMNEGMTRNAGYYRSLAAEPFAPALPRPLTESLRLLERAEGVIPSATQTFSKGPTQYVRGVSPVYLERGSGSHVWDVDGNEFIDYPMGLGPVILGHGYPRVCQAVAERLGDGLAFSLPHPLEVEVSELLVETIPCAEMVRFGKNGSDATSGAVRLARAYTGRSVIACCGYHGWQDWYIGTTTRRLGVPEEVAQLTVPFLYNDLASVEAIFEQRPGQVAAVIMEPVGIDEPLPGFLESVAELASRNGALLIYDEVVSGFRFALGGAQEFFGVTPDLACFGKALGNGFPIAAVVGRAEVMELFDEVFFSFTFGGEVLSLAAAQATVCELREQPVLEHIWNLGRQLKEGVNVMAAELGVSDCVRCVGYPPRTVVEFTSGTSSPLVLKSLFQQECLRRGVLFSGAQNICYSHSAADVDTTLRVYGAAMARLREGLAGGAPEELLEGPPVEPVFRQP